MTFIFGFLFMATFLSLLTCYVVALNKLSEVVRDRFGLESAILFNGIIQASVTFAVFFAVLEG